MKSIPKRYDNTYRSDCHDAIVYVVSDVFGDGTNHYNCDKCNNPCNFHFRAEREELPEPVGFSATSRLPEPNQSQSTQKGNLVGGAIIIIVGILIFLAIYHR